MSSSSERSASLLKNALVFAIGTFGSKVLVLLVIPLCTHFIAAEGMGMYDLLNTLNQLLQPIAILALSESLFRWLLEQGSDRRVVYSTWLTLFVVFLLIFSLFYFAVTYFFPFNDTGLLYLLVVIGCIYQGVQYGTRGLHANKLFAIQGLLYAITYCVCSYLFVVHFRLGYQGLLYAIFIASLVAVSLMLWIQPELRQYSLKSFDKSLAKELLRYSVFLLPNQLSWWALSMLNRLFIVGFLGYAANGIYSVAMKFPTALSMVSQVFLPAWQEQAVELYGTPGADEYFSLIFKRYARLLFCLLFPGVPATVMFVRLAMDVSYGQASELVAILYLGACFSALSNFMGVLYLCARDTRGAASTTIWGALANAILSIVLIPTLGLVGSAISSALGNMMIWLIRIVQTKKYCALQCSYVEIVVLAMTVVILSILANACTSLIGIAVLVVIGAFAALALNHKSIAWVVSMVKGRVARR